MILVRMLVMSIDSVIMRNIFCMRVKFLVLVVLSSSLLIFG